MIGDIMLSNPKTDAVNAVSYPTYSDNLVESDDIVTGLTQKIVRIADGLMLGYAGYFDEAQKLIEYLLGEHRRSGTVDGIYIAIKEYFSFHQGKFEELQVILLSDIENNVRVWSRKCRSVKNNFLGSIFVLGSGTNQFMDYIDQVSPDESFKDALNPPSDSSKVRYVLRYITLTLKHQQLTGYGIDKSWGGGFELITRKNGKFFEKTDRIFLHFYSYSFRDGECVDIRGVGYRTFQFYVDDNLVIVTQPGTGQPSFYSVSSPLKPEHHKLMLSNVTRTAQLVYLHFVNRDNSHTYTHTSYHSEGNPEFKLGYKTDHSYYLYANLNYVRQIILDIENV